MVGYIVTGGLFWYFILEEVLEICAVITDFFIKPSGILNFFNQNFVLHN